MYSPFVLLVLLNNGVLSEILGTNPISQFNKSKQIFMDYDLSYIDKLSLNITIEPLLEKNKKKIIDYVSKHTSLSYKQIINRLNNIYDQHIQGQHIQGKL